MLQQYNWPRLLGGNGRPQPGNAGDPAHAGKQAGRQRSHPPKPLCHRVPGVGGGAAADVVHQRVMVLACSRQGGGPGGSCHRDRQAARGARPRRRAWSQACTCEAPSVPPSPCCAHTKLLVRFTPPNLASQACGAQQRRLGSSLVAAFNRQEALPETWLWADSRQASAAAWPVYLLRLHVLLLLGCGRHLDLALEHICQPAGLQEAGKEAGGHMGAADAAPTAIAWRGGQPSSRSSQQQRQPLPPGAPW